MSTESVEVAMESTSKVNMFTALKKYAVFSGRASRKEFFLFVLLSFLIGLPNTIVQIAVTSGAEVNVNLISICSAIASIWSLASIIPSIAVAVRRQHDLNLSGWLVLLIIVPFGSLFLLFLYINDSQPGENRFGSNPKGVNETNSSWHPKVAKAVILTVVIGLLITAGIVGYALSIYSIIE